MNEFPSSNNNITDLSLSASSTSLKQQQPKETQFPFFHQEMGEDKELELNNDNLKNRPRSVRDINRPRLSSRLNSSKRLSSGSTVLLPPLADYNEKDVRKDSLGGSSIGSNENVDRQTDGYGQSIGNFFSTLFRRSSGLASSVNDIDGDVKSHSLNSYNNTSYSILSNSFSFWMSPFQKSEPQKEKHKYETNEKNRFHFNVDASNNMNKINENDNEIDGNSTDRNFLTKVKVWRTKFREKVVKPFERSRILIKYYYFLQQWSEFLLSHTISKRCSLLIAFIIVYGADIHIAFFTKAGDPYFNSLSIICVVWLMGEILLRIIRKPTYIKRVDFYLQLLVLYALFVDTKNILHSSHIDYFRTTNDIMNVGKDRLLTETGEWFMSHSLTDFLKTFLFVYIFRLFRVMQLSLKLKIGSNYSAPFFSSIRSNSKTEDVSRNVRSRQETRTERAKLMEIENLRNLNDLTVLGSENINKNNFRASRRISIELHELRKYGKRKSTNTIYPTNNTNNNNNNGNESLNLGMVSRNSDRTTTNFSSSKLTLADIRKQGTSLFVKKNLRQMMSHFNNRKKIVPAVSGEDFASSLNNSQNKTLYQHQRSSERLNASKLGTTINESFFSSPSNRSRTSLVIDRDNENMTNRKGSKFDIRGLAAEEVQGLNLKSNSEQVTTMIARKLYQMILYRSLFVLAFATFIVPYLLGQYTAYLEDSFNQLQLESLHKMGQSSFNFSGGLSSTFYEEQVLRFIGSSPHVKYLGFGIDTSDLSSSSSLMQPQEEVVINDYSDYTIVTWDSIRNKNISYRYINRTISINQFINLSCMNSKSNSAERNSKYGTSTFWMELLDQKQNELNSKDDTAKNLLESEFEANILETKMYGKISEVYENFREFEIMTYETSKCLNSTFENLISQNKKAYKINHSTSQTVSNFPNETSADIITTETNSTIITLTQSFNCKSIVLFNMRDYVCFLAWISIITHTLLLTFFYYTTDALCDDANRLVITPIERMTDMVRKLAENPLACIVDNKKKKKKKKPPHKQEKNLPVEVTQLMESKRGTMNKKDNNHWITFPRPNATNKLTKRKKLSRMIDIL